MTKKIVFVPNNATTTYKKLHLSQIKRDRSQTNGYNSPTKFQILNFHLGSEEEK